MEKKYLEAILKTLAANLDYGVHVVTADKITYIYNDAIASFERTSPEDVIGKDFRKVFSNIPEEESTMLKALRTGTPTIQVEQKYQNKYGKTINTVNSTVPVFDDEQNVVAAIELSKNVTDIKELSDAVMALQSEAYQYPEMPRDAIKRYSFNDLIGSSPNYADIIGIAKRAAGNNASVFIYGETGTGKELVAQSIHYSSTRKDKPFLAQNCAALPESLLEGILFGTAKGGFTGAIDREGLFEQASGGTLLLDEISSMPYALQGKLLRVLQEDYIRRLGGTRDIPVDVRIIATVNEPPEQLIESGRLRKDLYYRLNIVNLRMPPLRERKSDIPILVDHFLDKHNKRFSKEVWMVSEEAMKRLTDYDYPGNVRELENIIMAAVSLAGNEHVLSNKLLRVPDSEGGSLLNSIGKPAYDPAVISLEVYLEEMEQYIIAESMKSCGGNISKAAELLGIKRQTLQHKLKKFGLARGDRNLEEGEFRE